MTSVVIFVCYLGAVLVYNLTIVIFVCYLGAVLVYNLTIVIFVCYLGAVLVYNLLKIAQTEDSTALHYCDYHLLSLAIGVVTVTFVIIVFTLVCYAILWFIHDKMESSEKFRDFVIECELDRRKMPSRV